MLHSAVLKSIKEMTDKKGTGDDDVSGDQILGEDYLKIMTQLINNIYETGQWSWIALKLQWLPSRRSRKLPNAATIAHTGKVVVRTLRGGNAREIDDVLGEDRLDLEQEKGTGMQLGC
jgi:hypothetical protein